QSAVDDGPDVHWGRLASKPRSRARAAREQKEQPGRTQPQRVHLGALSLPDCEQPALGAIGRQPRHALEAQADAFQDMNGCMVVGLRQCDDPCDTEFLPCEAQACPGGLERITAPAGPRHEGEPDLDVRMRVPPQQPAHAERLRVRQQFHEVEPEAVFDVAGGQTVDDVAVGAGQVVHAPIPNIGDEVRVRQDLENECGILVTHLAKTQARGFYDGHWEGGYEVLRSIARVTGCTARAAQRSRSWWLSSARKSSP